MPTPPQRVLILGATSAIAAEIARIYAGRGARLHLVGRSPDKLARVAEAARGGGGAAAVTTRAEDLARTAAAEAVVREAAEALGGIDVACIAHGLLGDQLATERDFAAAEEVIRTNFLSVVALLVPLANLMEGGGGGRSEGADGGGGGGGGGRIAVLSSVAGDRGRPRNYTYGAAKGALNVYLQGVRTRLWRRGVRVLAVRLGPVDTPMTASHRKHLLFARPDRVAARVVRGIDRGEADVYVPWFWRLIMAGVRNVPEHLIQRLGFLSGR